MPNDKLNQFIHEHKDLFNSCWHISNDVELWACNKCGEITYGIGYGEDVTDSNPDYTHHTMFITVWEKLKDRGLETKFILFVSLKQRDIVLPENGYIPIELINSLRLCELIKEFLENEKN